MVDRIQTNSEPSVTSLLSGIVTDAQELIKQQLLLFKHELKDDVNRTKEALPTLGAGAAITMTALILLGLTLANFLNWLAPEHLPLWGCYAVVTVLFGVVGCALLYFASKTLESLGMSRQAAEATKENLEWTTKPK
jgi:Putative Actinobacterial Holin-X, holin superfamily III